MDNNNEKVVVVKKYDCLQPRILEPEEMGNVDPRIYTIRKGGATGAIYYLWPWQYEARIQKERADKMEEKFQILDTVGKVGELNSQLQETKKALNAEKRKTNILQEQVSVLRNSTYGSMAYEKVLIAQENNQKLQLYHNQLQKMENENEKLKEQNKELKHRNSELISKLIERNREVAILSGQILDPKEKQRLIIEIEKLKEQNSKLKQQTEEVSVDSLLLEIEELTKENSRLKRQKAQPNREEVLSTSIMSLNEKIRDLESELRKYQREFGILP